MRRNVQHRTGRSERGIALSYILAVIALLTVATMFVARTQRGTAQALINQENRLALIDQFGLIRSRVIACAVTYPGGDNGTSYRTPFPAAMTRTVVRDLTCPGQPGANNLWSGTGGLSLPAPPSLYSDWRFVNDAASMRLEISARVGGSAIARGVLDGIASRLGNQASRSGDTLTIVLMN